MQYKNIALITAGGIGSRYGSTTPKQYHLLENNESMLRNSIIKFQQSPLINAILVVIRPEDHDLYSHASQNLSLLPFCYGGATRQDSVKNGLIELKQYQPELVLIHDANRPFVSTRLINEVVETLQNNINHGVVPILPIVDTIKLITEDKVELLDRNHLFRIQTPQGFHYQQLYHAYMNTIKQYTDESTLMEAKATKIIYIQGEEENKKITHRSEIL